MSISYLALNDKAILQGADIEKVFIIELVIVTGSGEIYAHDNVALSALGEGERFLASLQGDKLERADNEPMDSRLRSVISQAVRNDPRIGRIWVAQFTLYAAVDHTPNVRVAPCDWYNALATAQEKLAGNKGKLETTYNHHDPSTEQEKSAIPKGGNGANVVDAYQIQLGQLDMMVKMTLATAKGKGEQ